HAATWLPCPIHAPVGLGLAFTIQRWPSLGEPGGTLRSRSTIASCTSVSIRRSISFSVTSGRSSPPSMKGSARLAEALMGYPHDIPLMPAKAGIQFFGSGSPLSRGRAEIGLRDESGDGRQAAADGGRHLIEAHAEARLRA